MHHNDELDFSQQSSSVYGFRNYPELDSVNTAVDTYSTFSWVGPFPANDTVLRKESGIPGFGSSLALAYFHHRQRNVPSAISAYRNAFELASTANEVRKCLTGWLALLSDVKNLERFSQGVRLDSLEEVFSAEVNPYTQNISKNPFARSAAQEIMARHHERKKNYASASLLFSDLAVSPNVEQNRKPRMWYDLIKARYFGLENYQSAYSAFLTLQSLFPGTKEVIYSKIILKLPLTANDIQNLNKQDQEEKAKESGSAKLDYLMTNYPNPFTTSSTIQFFLPGRRHVSVDVYDLHGVRLARILNEVREGGLHSVDFVSGDLPSGTYLYRLTATDLENESITQRTSLMVLSK